MSCLDQWIVQQSSSSGDASRPKPIDRHLLNDHSSEGEEEEKVISERSTVDDADRARMAKRIQSVIDRAKVEK